MFLCVFNFCNYITPIKTNLYFVDKKLSNKKGSIFLRRHPLENCNVQLAPSTRVAPAEEREQESAPARFPRRGRAE